MWSSVTLTERQRGMRERVWRGWDRKRGRPKDGRSFRRSGNFTMRELVDSPRYRKELLWRLATHLLSKHFSMKRIANQLGVSVTVVEKLLKEGPGEPNVGELVREQLRTMDDKRFRYHPWSI